MLFELEVIREMLEDTQQIPADSEFHRLKGCHFLSVIPPSKTKEKPQNRCVASYKNKFRKVLVIIAKLSRSRLCPAPCFMIYHIHIDFK